MRPSPGNCSAVAMAPTALTAPATQARITAPKRAYEREPSAIRENSVIGKIALHRLRTIRTGFRPTRSDKAPAKGVTRMTATAAAVESRSELTRGSQECRNVGDPDIISDRAQGRDCERSEDPGAMVG